MKIILIGATERSAKLIQKALAGAGHEIVKVGRKSGEFPIPSRDRELRKCQGSFIKPSARLMPWPLQQAKSHFAPPFGTHR